MKLHTLAWASAALLLAAMPVGHADQDPEQRLRDALRQAVSDMRAAQDQAAQATAQVAQLQADKTALQAQLDATKAQLAKSAKADDLKALQAQLTQSRADDQQNLAKWQSAYQQVVEVAKGKDVESRKQAQIATADSRALETCKATNKKLIDVAMSTLHLYEDQHFRNLLFKSYEPLLGTSKVDLENLVQDYEDKIHAQEYVESAPPPAAPAGSPKPR